jgi:geranylgeranyl diphosphate synthase type I
MIAGKTSAIVRYAAWAGALLGGADDGTAERFGEFGLALGLGFQVQDDLLGVWGSSDVTGKAAADDIRRKKQSLPIVLLHANADSGARAELDSLYQAAEIDAAGVERVLALLDRFAVRPEVERLVTHYHDEARAALASVTPSPEHPAASALSALVEALSARTH